MALGILAMAVLCEGHKPSGRGGGAGGGKKKTSARAVLDGYHISDRNDGRDDDDEESRSTVWPSRTSWGAAHSLAEKYPFLFERRFGIRAYDYWWGYTAAQIELMTTDVPIVRYKNDKEKKHNKKDMDALADAWAARRKGKTLKGEKVSLSEWLRSPEPT